MKSEDMKMEKFKIWVRDIDNYLGASRLCSNASRIVDGVEYGDGNPLLYLLDEEDKGLWFDSILNNSFCDHGFSWCLKGGSNKIWLEEIEKNNIMEFIRQIRICDCSKGEACNAASNLMFWLLFAISVDNYNYDNNLNVAADVAYLLDFDEETLGDWITAVKGVLSGKKLYELEYKTEEGKEYFIRNNRY